MKKVAIGLLLICAAAFAQQKGSFTDKRDGKTYKTVKIGEQTWMAENLNYNAEGSFCYDNKPANCQKYGRLYNWATAMKACPSGWHLPSDAEWSILINLVGGYKVAGNILKASNGWAKNGNGVNAVGFSALPGGHGFSNSKFHDIGGNGGWWTASQENGNSAYSHELSYEDGTVDSIYNSHGKFLLYSVRCVETNKDAEKAVADLSKQKKEKALADLKAKVKQGSFTDSRDGKTYKTAKIGEQTWMAENLNYEASGSKCFGEGGKVYTGKAKEYIILSNSEIQANCAKYGRLYNWETATKACPSGWHLPSNEWITLINLVGDWEVAGNILKASDGWAKNGNGVDAVGFSALPGGYGGLDSNFYGVGNFGCWWTASEDLEKSGNNYAYGHELSYEDGTVYGDNSHYKFLLHSVRCVQDRAAPEDFTKFREKHSKNKKKRHQGE